MVTLDKCPLCGNPSLDNFLIAKDYFLTGKEFSIQKCNSCGFKFTNPRPDKNEINSYYESDDYLSHSSKRFNLKSILFRTVRSVNLRTKYRIIKSNAKGKRILDIGCGTGEFLAYCQKKGMITMGIEPNVKARNYAREIHNLQVEDESILDEITNNTKFDIVTLWHVLEHVPDLNTRMNQIRKILNPDGKVIIAVPNSNSWDAKYYGGFWAAFDLPRHLYHFNKESLGQLVHNYGFQIENYLPMKWDSYFISLLSEKYKNGQSNYLKAFFNGLRSNLMARKNFENYSSTIIIAR